MMGFRVALTEAKVGFGAVSSVMPVGLALNGLKKAGTGVGGKISGFGKRQSPKEAFDYWAEFLVT